MKDKDVKSKCRNRLCFIPMILVALFLANCQDDEAKMVFDPGIPVQITGFSPDTGGRVLNWSLVVGILEQKRNLLRLW
ncbi:Uncharacterised protein [Odoribacter splanchnicus]|nr:Uncharacterised protein [Odoribacter splanchnicus]